MFGTLRKDSYFSPGEVLDEATAFDVAIRRFGKALFDFGGEIAPEWFDAWNALVEQWRGVWAQMNAWDGWVYRAKDATRDTLLNLEAEYTRIKDAIGPDLEGDAGETLEDATPETQRTPDNIGSAVPTNFLTKIGWEVVAGAAVVVVGLVVLAAVARKGGVKLPGMV